MQKRNDQCTPANVQFSGSRKHGYETFKSFVTVTPLRFEWLSGSGAKTIFPFLLWILAAFNACQTDKNKTVSGEQDEMAAPPDALFQKVPASESNIHFMAEVKEDFVNNIVKNPHFYNGGGVGVIDVNNDGLQDLFFSSTTGSCNLYLNQGNFKFKNITALAGVASPKGFKTGVAIADVNGDGWQDIYVCRTGTQPGDDQRNLLYINNWNNTFSESAADYGVDDASGTNCANFFDYDLDGDLDLYVVNNPPDVKLVDHMDLERRPDGSLVRRNEPRGEFDSDRLYRNDGPPLQGGGGGFTDVSKQAGIHDRAFGLSSIVMDWNGDHWPDIFVANDFIQPDFLYINNRNGTFTDEAAKSFRHLSNHTMGSDVADINLDGLPDLIALDMLAEDYQRQKSLSSIMKEERYRLLGSYGYGYQLMRNVLHLNNGPASASTVQTPTFSEIGCMAGIFQTDWSWSVLAQDYDLDAWPDMFITNGYRRDITDLDYMQFVGDSLNNLYKGSFPKDMKSIYEYLDLIPSVKLRNYMYRNKGDLQFENTTIAWGFTDKTFSNGAAYADLDNDGDADLVVNNIESEALLYRNTAADTKKGNWLHLRIEGPKGNPTGVGVVARVTAGGRTFQQELTPVRGFYSCNEPALFFGLGQASAVDKIEVLFPPGNKLVTLQNQAVNQRLLVKASDAKPGALPPLVQYQPAYFKEAGNTLGIDYVHKEDDYRDFNNERLLPWRLSTPGPAIATGDVNGDQLDDFYVGGSAGSAAALFLQQAGGKFTRASSVTWNIDALYEDSGAAFFDADGDGDQDLFVASGGNSAPAGSDKYRPRLYLNDGKGNFTRAETAIPAINDSGSAVAVFDYDNDGDPDIFLGGWCVPGEYPTTPGSHVLRNDWKQGNTFTDVTTQIAPDFASCGMVRAITFADLNGDKKAEMLVAGEWMPVSVFQFKNGKFENATAVFGLEGSNGFWRSLVAADFDGDGDTDFAAGNLGLNTRLTASPEAPLHIYAKDFDKNGSIDPLMAYTAAGVEYPLALRDVLLKQLPALKKKFVRNRPYAYARLEHLYPRAELETARHFMAGELRSAYFENQGGKFVLRPLHNMAQIAPAQAIVVADLNTDGKPDLILAGNDYGQQVETGPIDAGNGLTLLNDGKGNFNPVPAFRSGLWATREARSARLVFGPGGKKILLVGNNNSKMQVFELN
ncbi:MAG: VCBS repeat-containing protein [Thermoanaerobaculia bacterium]|nr:VCBS repeat-containing protein [Thermoanaerobaculia bacterium]